MEDHHVHLRQGEPAEVEETGRELQRAYGDVHVFGNAAGHRTGVTELSGRTVSYGYDSIYRLTSETIAGDPNDVNGAASYVYDSDLPPGFAHRIIRHSKLERPPIF